MASASRTRRSRKCRAAVAALHSGTPAARQGGQPARHRHAPGWRSARARRRPRSRIARKLDRWRGRPRTRCPWCANATSAPQTKSGSAASKLNWAISRPSWFALDRGMAARSRAIVSEIRSLREILAEPGRLMRMAQAAGTLRRKIRGLWMRSIPIMRMIYPHVDEQVVATDGLEAGPAFRSAGWSRTKSRPFSASPRF